MYRPVSRTASSLLLLLVVILAPVPGGGASANNREEGIQVPNPGTDLWREVRKRQQPLWLE